MPIKLSGRDDRNWSHLPAWPRAMNVELAAAYVALSVTSFRVYVVPLVPAIPLTPGRVGWLREDLDAGLDKQAGRAPAATNQNRKVWGRK